MLEPSSDERQPRRENWPRPSGLRRKSAHTSFSSLPVGSPCAADSASHPIDEDLSMGTPGPVWPEFSLATLLALIVLTDPNCGREQLLPHRF